MDDRHLRGSTNSDLKFQPHESDTDSIQDYVDGETAGIISKKISFDFFFFFGFRVCFYSIY